MMRKLILVISSFIVPCALALQPSDMNFVNGDDPTGYDAKGRPTVTYNILSELPTDVLQNVYSMLPESTPVNPNFISTDSQSSISIDDELNGAEYAEMSVTFLNEGAGYRNTFGYFIYETNSPPNTPDDVEHFVIFPNASKPGAGTLLEGDTVDLNIELISGQSVGFFVIPNGWGYSGTYNTIESLGPWNTPFYSLSKLNPEVTLVDRRHNVTFVDPQNELLIIGFEDLLRPTGDNDFNDILFTVRVTPFIAVDGVNADGTIDASYEILTQVNQPDVSTTSVYPASDQWATLAFEDKWPLTGDYDFNDLVLRQRVTETLDGQRRVKEVKVTYQVQAMGGTYHNGFALRLPGVSAGNIELISLIRNGETVSHDIIETGLGDVSLIISPDTRQDIHDLGALTENCRLFRVERSCLAQQTQSLQYELDVIFLTPVEKETLGRPPYDPFIFSSDGHYRGELTETPPGRGWETHLKQFQGTAAINQSYFGQHADSSNGVNSFVTANNFPWVINLADQWLHPLEKVDIGIAYPDFAEWVTSSGETNTDWYRQENAVSNRIAN